jgi:hypothetical protein
MGGGGFLGLGPAPSAPAAPNYTAAAQATSAGNLETARAASAANRINQFTPYGSLVYSQQGKFDPKAYEQAQEAYKLSQQGAGLPEGYSLTDTNPFAIRASVQPRDGYQYAYGPKGERIEVPKSGLTAPRIEDFLTAPAGPDEGWTATQTLSPEQQQLLDYQNQASIGLGRLAGQGLGYVENMLNTPFDTSRLAQMQSSVSPADMQRLTGEANLGQMGQAEAQLRAGQAPNLQTSLGQNVGMAGWDRASDLLMSRLNPQIEQSQDRLRAQLANQGIVAGTEAYDRAMQQQGQRENDLRTQAQLQAQGIQQNLFGQELQAGQFGNQAMLGQNQAQLANLGFTNQAQQADFANQLAGMGFNNQQIQQMYQNRMGQQQANNAIAQQEYANRMAGANLSNQARQQGLQEQAYLRNEPLNTLSAVRTGAQVQGPQFVNSFNQATTQGADLLGAAGMQYNAQMGDFNARQAAQQNFNQGLMGLGGAGVMAFSDIRMKENIKQIHWLPNGLPVYEYEYKPEFKDHPFAGHGVHIGVMAQEVEMVKPEAVITNADGYKMVNYGLLT